MALKSMNRSKLTMDQGPLAVPPPVEALAPMPQRRERATAVPPSRQGLVPFGFFIPPEARKQLKGWAGLNGRTTQDIGQEMLDDWFAKHGLHRLAGSRDMPE
jgi:hypothetical protein